MTLGHPPLGIGARLIDILEINTLLPCVLIQTIHTKFRCSRSNQTIVARIGRVTKIWRSGPAHWDRRGRGWSPEAWIFFTCVICQIWPFYVKPHERNGNPPEKFDPSRPAFQGYSKSLEPTLIHRLGGAYLWLVRDPSMGVPFPINGDFRRKLQIFPTPCALTPRRKFSWNSVTAIALQETRVMR